MEILIFVALIIAILVVPYHLVNWMDKRKEEIFIVRYLGGWCLCAAMFIVVVFIAVFIRFVWGLSVFLGGF